VKRIRQAGRAAIGTPAASNARGIIRNPHRARIDLPLPV